MLQQILGAPRRALTLSLLWCGLLLAVAGRAAVLGPVISAISPTSAQISWRDGDTPADGVQFGENLLPGTADNKFRKVTLADLKPDTAYTYTFVHDNVRDEYSFRTAPAEPMDFTFVAYGDTRSQPARHREVIAGIRPLQPRFILNTGDLVADGSKTDLWDEFFAVAGSVTGSTPYFPVAGNHEGNSDLFHKIFAPAATEAERDSRVFTYGEVRVILLNCTRNVSAQRDWLEKTLAADPGKATWTVVAFHYPPYSSSARNGDAGMRDKWVPLLEKYKVDVVFLGHDHFYERSEKAGVTYIICGGGGAPLYDPNSTKNEYQKAADKSYHFIRADVTTTTLHLRMIRTDGTIGDEVTLTKEAKKEPQGEQKLPAAAQQ